MKTYDVVIAGAGPAGLSAAVECGRYGIKTLLIERNRIGETKKTWSDFPENIRSIGLEEAVRHITSRVIQKAYTGLDLVTDAEMAFLDDKKALEILRSQVNTCYVDVVENCECFSYNSQDSTVETQDGRVRTKILIDATGYKTQGEIDSPTGLTFDQFCLKKDVLLQTFAYIARDTNLNQQDSVMFDLPFATREKVWYWINPLGNRDAWIGAMCLTKAPLPWDAIKKGTDRYMKCRKIEAEIIEERKGYIPSFRLENIIHFDHVLHTGDVGPGAVSGTFFGFVTSINHGKHVAGIAKKSLEDGDYSQESYRKLERGFYTQKLTLNYLLGVVGEKIIIAATDGQTSKLLQAMSECGDEILIKRLKTDLDRRDIIAILRKLNNDLNFREKCALIPWRDFMGFSEYLLRLSGKLLFS